VIPLLLRRPICWILGGHDWEKRGTPVVETVPVVGGYAVADSLTVERIKRIDVHYVSVPPPQEPCPMSLGLAEDEDERRSRTVTCTLTASAGSDITAGDLVTFTGEEPYFACRRCGFREGPDQWEA